MSPRQQCLQLVASLALLALAACDGDPVAPDASGAPLPRRELTTTTLSPRPMLSAGGYHSCALKTSGIAACWGAIYSPDVATVPPKLPLLAQVSAGGSHTCALTTDAWVACWGDSESAALDVPPDLSDVVQIDAGGAFTCALRADGTVRCWGHMAEWTSVDPPSGLAGVTQVSGGSSHACALSSEDGVVCWGLDWDGRTTVPAKMAAATQISAGPAHTCVVTVYRTVTCWGSNHDGESTVPAGLTDVVQVSAGGSGLGVARTCALKADGVVVCWGTGDNNGPIVVPAGTYTQVSVGGYHICAVRTDGSVVCFGDPVNLWGQLSVPSGLNLLWPQAIAFTSTLPNPGYVGDVYTATATGGGSGSPVTFSSLSPLICSVASAGATLNSASVNFLAEGTCVVAADQAGSAEFAPAPRISQRITVRKRSQTITFGPPPASAILGASHTVSATGGGSGNAVTFSLVQPSPCTLSGTTLTFANLGTCTIVANQAGNDFYYAAVATQSFTVVYDFGASSGGGFSGPVSATTWNSARGGQSVPVTFDLGGNRGLQVIAAGYPRSIQIACPSTTLTDAPIPEATTSAGGSGLTYDTSTGLYTYVWKTDRAWAGTCREFMLKLADNSEHPVRFDFRR